jgi:hypothetical protein
MSALRASKRKPLAVLAPPLGSLLPLVSPLLSPPATVSEATGRDISIAAHSLATDAGVIFLKHLRFSFFPLFPFPFALLFSYLSWLVQTSSILNRPWFYFDLYYRYKTLLIEVLSLYHFVV